MKDDPSSSVRVRVNVTSSRQIFFTTCREDGPISLLSVAQYVNKSFCDILGPIIVLAVSMVL